MTTEPEFMKRVEELEKRLKELEKQFAAEDSQQQSRGSARVQAYQQLHQLLRQVLSVGRELRYYSQCKLTSSQVPVYYQDPEGHKIHVGAPYGFQSLDNRAKRLGFRGWQDLFDRHLTTKRLELWEKLFSRAEIEVLVEKIGRAASGETSYADHVQAIARKLEGFQTHDSNS